MTKEVIELKIKIDQVEDRIEDLEHELYKLQEELQDLQFDCDHKETFYEVGSVRSGGSIILNQHMTLCKACGYLIGYGPTWRAPKI